MNDQDKVNIIIRTRKILAVEEAWIKGVLARDVHGKRVMVDDPDACRFCMMGGILRAAPDAEANEAAMKELMDTIMSTTWRAERVPVDFRNQIYTTVSKFNDHPDTTWADVSLVLQETADRILARLPTHSATIPEANHDPI